MRKVEDALSGMERVDNLDIDMFPRGGSITPRTGDMSVKLSLSISDPVSSLSNPKHFLTSSFVLSFVSLSSALKGCSRGVDTFPSMRRPMWRGTAGVL